MSFITAAPVEPGTELSFIAHGPLITGPSGGQTAFGYGYKALVDRDRVTLTYGLARGGHREPNVVKGDVHRGGNVITVDVSKSELDRDPGNMTGRPPFPFRGFTFEARVITPPSSSRAQEADHFPNERTGLIGISDGRRCPSPCAQR